MPELPEVETVVRQLAPRLAGRRLERVLVRDPKLAAARRRGLRGRRVDRVFRVGKRIVIALEPGPGTAAARYLEVHLRMTGRLLWAESWPPPPGGRRDGRVAGSGERRLPAGRQEFRSRGGDGGGPRRQGRGRDVAGTGPGGGRPPGRRPLPPPRAVLLLDRGAVLFVDPRRFGTMRWTPQPPAPSGVDPTGPGFTTGVLADLLGGSRTPIKAWLMRQDRLEGFGNIYASEVLHAAGIDPRRPAGALARDEVRRLAAATRRILRAAIRHCGTTFSDFQGVLGTVGGYRRFLAVYGRAGEPCPRCGTAISRIVQQGRSTYFCPRCQR